MIRAEIDTNGRLRNVRKSDRLTATEVGYTRVVLTEWPTGLSGEAGWTFQRTGTHASGCPEGVAVAEPVSLAAWKKKRVIELEKERVSVLAAAASTGWDYSTELAAIDSEIESLK